MAGVRGRRRRTRWWRPGKRQAPWDQLTARTGWSYEPGPDRELGNHFLHLDVLRGRRPVTGFDIMRGTFRERPLLVVTLRVGSGSEQIVYGLASLQLVDGRALPDLAIRLENARIRAANLFTNRDIDFDSIEFSRTFEVSGSDRRFATEFCSPVVMDYLLEHRERIGVQLEVDGPWLLTVHGGWAQPELIRPRLSFLSDLADLLPGHLLDADR